MGFYSRHAAAPLKELLDQMSRTDPAERMSLVEEIDLSRIMAERYVRIFEEAVLNPESKASPELRASATTGLRTALSHVSDIAQAAARVRALSQNVVDVEAIGYVVQKVIEVIERELADRDRGLADLVIAGIRDIKLPSDRPRITVS